jgi:zinc/manganese transport system substrate-binding protein
MIAALAVTAFFTLGAGDALPGPIVAAEAAYADIAAQLAGPAARVSAILRNPSADPHSYEPTPSAARLVAGARIVIVNGIGYDPWMDRLIAAAHAPDQTVITVADLLHRRPGDNAHLWYDPAAMPALAASLCATWAYGSPASARRCAETQASLASIAERVATLRRRFAGAEVAATEPVLGPLLAALGLVDRHAGFERAVMNGAEPRATDIAALEDAVRTRRIRLLVVNAQATSPQAERLENLARTHAVPVVPVTETLPPGENYQQWIGGELTALGEALAPPPQP